MTQTAKVFSGSKEGKVKYPYDAMVYIDGTNVIAVDNEGNTIKRGTAGTDDATVIQAAINELTSLCPDQTTGRMLHISSGDYNIDTTISITHPHTIVGDGPSQTRLISVSATTMIEVAPPTSTWEYARFTLRDMTLNGNRVGLYGIYIDSQRVVFSYFENLVIRSFLNYGVYDDSNWGNTYVKVFFKHNGTFYIPPAPVVLDSGGICIRCNCALFYGCAFDWNSCGIIFSNGYGSCFYGCVVEGNVYHGIYGYSTPASGWYPQHITFDGLQLELNGTHNNSYPGSLELLYDIYIKDSTASFWSIRNCKTSGTYVTKSAYSLGIGSTVLNYRSQSGRSVEVSGSGSVVDANTSNSSIGTNHTILSTHVHRNPGSIIVYKIGTTCYAKDASTGKILVNSTTDQDVFTYLGGASLTGSTIYVKQGEYSITGWNLGATGVVVKGESLIGGTWGTTFKVVTGSTPSSAIQMWYGCELHNICIDANSIDCTSGGVVLVSDTVGMVYIDRCYIYSPGGSTSCIYIYGTNHIRGIQISNSIFYSSFPGVHAASSNNTGINITNNIFSCTRTGDNYGSAVRIASAKYCNVTNNYITGGSRHGVYIGGVDATNNIVTGNTILGAATSSIDITNGENNIVKNNMVDKEITYNTFTSLIKDNIGYIHISEIRDSLNNVLETLGDTRLLNPCTPITGTTITDYTRFANTLTAQASVATWYGFQGRATYYDFNGTTHYLYRANDTDFDFGNSVTDQAFSVVCCVNPDNVTSRQIIGKWDANNLREWRLFFNASGYPTLQLYDESVDKYIGRQDQTAFTTGSWKVLVATYDGSGICAGCKIYIDGVQLDDADYTDAGYVAMEAINTNLMVGTLKNAAAYSEYYDGKMTWIGVAAKELSADEVWSLTQRLKGVLGI